ncbi:MAG: hybrid sensor histidine kinase/response regulator, partial [Woeseiaceae bacterium]
MNRKSYDNFDRETLSLENCDKEPVHIPGHIQGFATLIATDPKLKTITYCSDNGEETFGQSLDALLGHSIRTIFDTELLHALNNTLSLSSVHHQRERVGHYVNSDQWFDVWAHLHNDIPIVEFERIDKHQQEDIQSILTVRSLLARLQKIEQLDETLNDAVIGLQSFSGFDRVLIYQFDKNGDGEVKAEARSPAMDPLLGLRFPKWDIPNQARDIMRKLPLRVIADVDATPVMLRQADPTQAPLDLTVA